MGGDYDNNTMTDDDDEKASEGGMLQLQPQGERYNVM